MSECRILHQWGPPPVRRRPRIPFLLAGSLTPRDQGIADSPAYGIGSYVLYPASNRGSKGPFASSGVVQLRGLFMVYPIPNTRPCSTLQLSSSATALRRNHAFAPSTWPLNLMHSTKETTSTDFKATTSLFNIAKETIAPQFRMVMISKNFCKFCIEHQSTHILHNNSSWNCWSQSLAASLSRSTFETTDHPEKQITPTLEISQ